MGDVFRSNTEVASSSMETQNFRKVRPRPQRPIDLSLSSTRALTTNCVLCVWPRMMKPRSVGPIKPDRYIGDNAARAEDGETVHDRHLIFRLPRSKPPSAMWKRMWDKLCGLSKRLAARGVHHSLATPSTGGGEGQAWYHGTSKTDTLVALYKLKGVSRVFQSERQASDCG